MSTELSPAASPDLNEIIFIGKNKEYGAYRIRKYYAKYLSTAVVLASLFFVLSVSIPLIIKWLTPKEPVVERKLKILDYTQLSEPPSIDKKETQEIVEAPPPLKTTIKFLPPVVKPDDQVTEEYIPTQDELKNVDPGKVTQEGDPGGVDYSLFEVKEEPKVVDEPKQDTRAEVFTYVEEMPSFPGGTEAMMQFITSNIVYPEIAKRAGVEGRVFVSLTIMKSGEIRNVQVLKGIGAGCDEAAVEVCSKMPRWIPGRQNGNPVNVQLSVPILFKLQ